MSHTTTIRTEITDEQALKSACDHQGVRMNANSRAKLYDGSTHQGHVVHLKDWSYPVIFTKSGEAKYDNYNGCWGDEAELHKLTARYAVERVLKKARVLGHHFKEVPQEDGSIKLVRGAPGGQQTIITADDAGNVTVEAAGYKGKACLDATRPYESALGIRSDFIEKPEFKQQDNQQQERQGQ